MPNTELKILVLKSVLLPRKIVFFEPEVLQNATKFVAE